MQKKNTKRRITRKLIATAKKNLVKARAASLASWRDPQRIVERFWARVEKGHPDECWPWKGARKKQGYGTVAFLRKDRFAHRVAFEFTYGPIPKGMDCCHKCDNPPCCNPNHLFAGTRTENLLDSVAKGRYNSHLRGKRSMTDEGVIEMRRLWGTGNMSHRQLAQKFGISRPQVGQIVNRKCWKHI